MTKISKTEFLPIFFLMQISQSIYNNIFSDFIWLLLTVSNFINLEITFVEKCKKCPVFGHKMKTKPQMTNLRHCSLQKSS